MSHGKKVTHLVQVRRGTMRINYPFDSMGLLNTTPVELAWNAAMGFAHLQAEFKDRENTEPIPTRGKVPMVLKLPDQDGSLQPTISLLQQLSGKWTEMDAQELGEGAVLEDFGRCSIVILELVDSLRAV